MEKLSNILQSTVAWIAKLLLAHVILCSFLISGIFPEEKAYSMIYAFIPDKIVAAYSIEGFKRLFGGENLYKLSILLLLAIMYFLLSFVRFRRVRKEFLSRCAEEIKKEESNHQHAKKLKEFTPEELNLNEQK